MTPSWNFDRPLQPQSPSVSFMGSEGRKFPKFCGGIALPFTKFIQERYHDLHQKLETLRGSVRGWQKEPQRLRLLTIYYRYEQQLKEMSQQKI